METETEHNRDYIKENAQNLIAETVVLLGCDLSSSSDEDHRHSEILGFLAGVVAHKIAGLFSSEKDRNDTVLAFVEMVGATFAFVDSDEETIEYIRGRACVCATCTNNREAEVESILAARQVDRIRHDGRKLDG